MDLLGSYLEERAQYGGHESGRGKVECGVPQGSVLGPLFFIIFVNMMRACKGPDLVLFADDIDIFAEGSNPAELFERVNRGLMELSRWFRCNRLALNQEDGVCLFCWGPSPGG